MMAGWSSFNKYSLFGGLRAAARSSATSCRAPGAVGVIMLAGTLNLKIVRTSPAGSGTGTCSSSHWRSSLLHRCGRRGNRAPFDLTEADSEIVAGFATEYSGMRFGFFFFAEYVNVFILSAMTVVLFFGGWNAPSTATDPRLPEIMH